MADSSVSQSQLSEEFMKDFNARKDNLSTQISKLSLDSGVDVNEELSKISSEIQNKSKLLHDAVMFLPSYSVKIRQNEIRDLERVLKGKEELLVPKKKFGFKSKMKPTAPHEIPSTPLVSNESQNTVINLSDKDNNYFTIENIKSGTVQYDQEKLNTNDVLVKECENCVIILVGGPSTLRLVNIKNCRLLCGPVRTSVFIDNVVDSTLFLCCQQLRTHSSEKLDIYLRVASRAIIEDCRNIRFGPYKWDHEKSEELHKKAEISPSLERYDAVDDFNWLSATQSPNWEVIPENEWKPFSSV